MSTKMEEMLSVLLFSAISSSDAKPAVGGEGYFSGRTGTFVYSHGTGGGAPSGGGGLPWWGILLVTLFTVIVLFVVVKCCIELQDIDFGTSKRVCYLCLSKVSEADWTAGHRRQCAFRHAVLLASLPPHPRLSCPKCHAKLRLWPRERGPGFTCDVGDVFCCRGIGGVEMKSSGTNRYNCFLCDYDMCDNCAQKEEEKVLLSVVAELRSNGSLVKLNGSVAELAARRRSRDSVATGCPSSRRSSKACQPNSRRSSAERSSSSRHQSQGELCFSRRVSRDLMVLGGVAQTSRLSAGQLAQGEAASRRYPDSLLLPPASSSQARRLSQVELIVPGSGSGRSSGSRCHSHADIFLTSSAAAGIAQSSNGGGGGGGGGGGVGGVYCISEQRQLVVPGLPPTHRRASLHPQDQEWPARLSVRRGSCIAGHSVI